MRYFNTYTASMIGILKQRSSYMIIEFEIVIYCFASAVLMATIVNDQCSAAAKNRI
jgi:hypothetical protein